MAGGCVCVCVCEVGRWLACVRAFGLDEPGRIRMMTVTHALTVHGVCVCVFAGGPPTIWWLCG